MDEPRTSSGGDKGGIGQALHEAGFIARARLFFNHLKLERFPNASSLATAARCSRNTAQRTIYRLRDEYLVPLDYNLNKKGYFLTNSSYDLPHLLPPGKDELTALLLARELVGSLDSKDLLQAIERLWQQMTQSNPAVQRDIEPLIRVFSSSSTALGTLADEGVLQYLVAASRADNVELTYCSPWRHDKPKQYLGRILHVHYSDARLYLKFLEATGREMTFNASFVVALKILDYDIPIAPVPKRETPSGTANWLEGFGVWSGADLESVEIRIKPPASRYFQKQIWHEDQVDTLTNEGLLIRRMPAIISPELVSRVLSLGRHLDGVRPQELESLVQAEIEMLLPAVNTAAATKR